MRSSEDTEAVLLVDASNAFNSLNWQVALHNIYVTSVHRWPPSSSIHIGTLRTFCWWSGSVVWGSDHPGWPLYALTTIPLINRLNTGLKQVWYADDASASGDLDSLLSWWNDLRSSVPIFGYHANASKTWLISKKPKRGSSLRVLRSTSPHGANLT